MWLQSTGEVMGGSVPCCKVYLTNGGVQWGFPVTAAVCATARALGPHLLGHAGGVLVESSWGVLWVTHCTAWLLSTPWPISDGASWIELVFGLGDVLENTVFLHLSQLKTQPGWDLWASAKYE